MSGVRLVAAVARGGALGRAGTMAWRLPEELAHFRAETAGCSVVVGARTWASLPRGLPGRRCHLVASRGGLDPGTAVAVHATTAAAVAAALAESGPDRTVVAGGARIYREALEAGLIAEVVLTRIDLHVDADAFLEGIDPAHWKVVDPGTWHREGGTRWRVERSVRDQSAPNRPIPPSDPQIRQAPPLRPEG